MFKPTTNLYLVLAAVAVAVFTSAAWAQDDLEPLDPLDGWTATGTGRPILDHRCFGDPSGLGVGQPFPFATSAV